MVKKKEIIRRPRESKYLKALQNLETLNQGVLTPQLVVDAARSLESPLHNYFEWDNKKASEKWRIWQARALLTTVKVSFVPGEQAQEAYYNAIISTDNTSTRGYVSASKALSDENIYKQVLAFALREVQYWQSKYQSISDLEGIVNTKKLAKIKAKIEEE